MRRKIEQLHLHLLRSILVVGINAALTPLLSAQATLQITSPLDGTVVHPGDTVTINVNGSGATFSSVFVIGEDQLESCGTAGTIPFQCSISIATYTNPGTYLLTAVALDTLGNEPDSSPITIDVEPSAPPASVVAQPPSLMHSWTGDMTGLRVIGTNSDGSTVELTKSTQTISQAPGIVTVTADGLVTAVGAGTTQIVIDGNIYVSVTVDPPISIAPEQASLTASQH